MGKNYFNSRRFYHYINFIIKLTNKPAIYSTASTTLKNKFKSSVTFLFILMISNFAFAASSITLNSVSPSRICFGASASLNVTFSKSGSFNNGNVFTAQMSDATGSFSNPVNIGSVVSRNAVPITATVPANTASGSGYQIRIISNSPAVISNSVSFIIDAPSIGGIVSSSISTCSGNNNGILNLSGQTGDVINWQFSSDGGSNWSVLSNTTTSQSYNNLTTSTIYKATVQSGSCSSINSSSATITVSPCTKVRNMDCGIAQSALNQLIYCDPVAGAVNYEWEFVNTASGFSRTKMKNNNGLSFDPSLISGIEYNKTYDVRVRTQVGTQWGNYSSVCQITTPSAIPGTKVRNADCGITLTNLNQMIYCDPVPGAVNYQWEFVHAASGFSMTKMRNNNGLGIDPTWISGIEYNKTYDVRVRAMVGTQWGSFTTVGQISTPAAIPGSKVRAADCGITLSTLNQLIYCDPVPGAVNYQWEFVDAASGFGTTKLRNNNSLSSDPSWMVGLEYNKTYEIRVRAKAGTLWGNYSSVCQITTPSVIPESKLRTADCGITLSAPDQLIVCDAVAGAVNYEWRFINTTTGGNIIKSLNNNGLAWDPAWAASLDLNTTYDVSIRAKAGTQWGSYGAVCQITTVQSREMAQMNEIQNNDAAETEKMSIADEPFLSFNVYPNPNNGLLTIAIPAAGLLEIYNQMGQLVFQENVNYNTTEFDFSNLNDGIYFLKLHDRKNIYNSRIVIQK